MIKFKLANHRGCGGWSNPGGISMGMPESPLAAKVPHREQRVSHSKTSKTSLAECHHGDAIMGRSTNVKWQLRKSIYTYKQS
jgi:hypothetical protein